MKTGASALLGAVLIAAGAATAQVPRENSAPPPKEPASKEIGAGALFVICSATPSANKLFDANCDAYLEGFLTGMKRAGVACPPPRAYREVRRALLGLPKAAIGDRTAGELLAPLVLAAYRCGEEKPQES